MSYVMRQMEIMGSIKALIKGLIPEWLIIYRNNKSSGVVLTFDDGPDEIQTPLILAILQQYKVQAIFFVLGRKAVLHPKLIRQIMEEGHILGNHSNEHLPACRASYYQYWDGIQSCQQIIHRITGEYPRYFRPPGGSFGLPALMAIKRSRLKNVLWSVESGEFGVFSNETPEQIHNRLVSVLKNQDVLLMHDNSEKIPVVLRTLIPALLAKGIMFAHPGNL